jgi:hypothetical protein
MRIFNHATLLLAQFDPDMHFSNIPSFHLAHFSIQAKPAYQSLHQKERSSHRHFVL